MTRTLMTAAAAAVMAIGSAQAVEKDHAHGTFGRLDHVFLIMMENQTNTDILGNPNCAVHQHVRNVANQATNYFAVGHPSAPNYLEIVGGSNFGLTNDFWPNWVVHGLHRQCTRQQGLRECLHADRRCRPRQCGGRDGHQCNCSAMAR